MAKYRIIKETKEITKDVKYYIERKHTFLIWTWWSKLKTYVLGYDISLWLDFDTYDKAKEKLDIITQGTIKEVCNE